MDAVLRIALDAGFTKTEVAGAIRRAPAAITRLLSGERKELDRSEKMAIANALVKDGESRRRAGERILSMLNRRAASGNGRRQTKRAAAGTAAGDRENVRKRETRT